MFTGRKLGLLLRLLWPVWHSAIIGLVFWLGYRLRLVTDLIPGLQLRIPPIDTQELFVFAVIAICMFVIIGFSIHAYRFHFSLERSASVYMKQRFFRVVGMTFIAYFGHGFVFVSGISRFILVWTVLVSGIIISFFDLLYSQRIGGYERRHPTSVLCVYNTDKQYTYVKKHLPDTYTVHYIKAQERHDITYEQYGYVIVMGDFSRKKLQLEFDKIRLANQTMYHVIDKQFLDNVVYTPVRMGALDAFRYTPTRLNEWMLVAKRFVDVLGSFLGLIILSPLLIVISFLIKISSPGRILYRQERIGKNGRVFVINKFRTMYTHLSVGKEYGGNNARKVKEDLMKSDANMRKGELQKIENDPRVTPVGRFLRKTSLDELPSLWNVLIGEMSLVGPRPHEVFEVDRYKSRQRRLLSMKPGITGYAQIKGRDQLSFDDEANYDLYYMQHWSLRLDFYIMIMTLGVVMKGR